MLFRSAAKNPTAANKAAAKVALQESTNQISEAGNKIAEAQDLAKQYAEVRKTSSINIILIFALAGVVIIVGLLIFSIYGFRNRKLKTEKTQNLIDTETFSIIDLKASTKPKKKVTKKISQKTTKKTVKKPTKKTSTSKVR